MIDVTNPASPVIAGSVDTPWIAQGVAVAGDYAYVADSNSGLQVVDITVPASPVIVGSVDTPGDARQVAVAGGHAFVADGAGLQVIDITNPAGPVTRGYDEWEYYGDLYYINLGVALAGSYAYVAGYKPGLQVISIANPAYPEVVASVNMPGYANGVAVAGDYAYVADGRAGVWVIDIANPASPVTTGAVDTPGEGAYGVAVLGSYVYVAGGNTLFRQCDDATAIEEPQSGEVPGASMLAIRSVSPNPFNPALEVSFESHGTGEVTMEIYDASGSRVRTVPLGVLGPGVHQAWWDGWDASGEDARSGVYFVRLRGSDGQSRAVKAVLVR